MLKMETHESDPAQRLKKRKKKEKTGHLPLLYPEKSGYLAKWISIGAFHQAKKPALFR